MPHDARLTATLALLSPSVEALRAAIRSTAEEARGYLAVHPHGSDANGGDLAIIERRLTTLAALAESVAQQLEELRRLDSLAAGPDAPESARSTSPAASAHQADKLAAWLLQQADLSGLS